MSGSGSIASTEKRMFRSGVVTDLCAEKQQTTEKTMSINVTVLGVGSNALEILGPLPNSNSWNRYILIVADYFSKWIETFPMPNQRSALWLNCY